MNQAVENSCLCRLHQMIIGKIKNDTITCKRNYTCTKLGKQDHVSKIDISQKFQAALAQHGFPHCCARNAYSIAASYAARSRFILASKSESEFSDGALRFLDFSSSMSVSEFSGRSLRSGRSLQTLRLLFSECRDSEVPALVVCSLLLRTCLDQHTNTLRKVEGSP